MAAVLFAVPLVASSQAVVNKAEDCKSKIPIKRTIAEDLSQPEENRKAKLRCFNSRQRKFCRDSKFSPISEQTVCLTSQYACTLAIDRLIPVHGEREEHMYTVVGRTRGPPPVPTPPIQPGGYPQGSLEKERNPYPSAPDMDDEEGGELFRFPSSVNASHTPQGRIRVSSTERSFQQTLPGL
ncbi:hypothetical protein K469DRAFT_692101 [Zopfia rhizophila CBS 207.26]|uniref:Uncharacterized protein n=1 Tax=Zopfia rhizophila CBS 207.26 TaxID=1314779 RepID=A0A6A6DU64_9PEZI|nr:hypothetical protein K469DRAFT_692101 [Zopfia rhizophila CBS 207.26]